MRYEKGAISINKDRDVPVLVEIRNARMLRLSQLYESLTLSGLEPNRRSAYWRVKRLIEADLVRRYDELPSLGESLYGITRAGLALLESHGHALISVGAFTKFRFHLADAIHMVELNEFRIALMRAGSLVSWKGELEVLSENLALYGEGVKDYDAIVTVRVGDENVRFALEYERTAKSAARYREIRIALEEDHQVDLVLYLTPSQELMYLLTRELQGLRKRLCFGISNQFKASTLMTKVFAGAADGREAAPRYQSFCEALQETSLSRGRSLA